MAWTEQLAALPEAERNAVIAELPPEVKLRFAYDWRAWRREAQKPPPGDWRYWLILAGRGFGKTRVGAETVREWATSGDFEWVNLIGATADDARDIMIQGESGIMSICPPSERPFYRPSLRRLDWQNGCKSLIFTADEPERLRGKQHQRLWCDELASWRKGYADPKKSAWTQAKLGLRLPPDPRAILTTTPKPMQILRDLIANRATVVTSGSTYDNRENLDPAFFAEIITEYEGTYLGSQELRGELLEEAEGALWQRAWIDRARTALPEDLIRVAVGVDPPGGATECGIVVSGLAVPEVSALEDAVVLAIAKATAAPELRSQPPQPRAIPEHYVLADYSERLSAARWGEKVLRVAIEHRADVIAAEKNFGGDMVHETLRTAAKSKEFRDADLPRLVMVTASRGKAIRAEPWALLAEQGRLHHAGVFGELEDEQCTWEPNTGQPSPNRLDGMVWSLAALERAPAEVGNVVGWL